VIITYALLPQLQCDLLELRDAHAKLRTTNEKLRREKERNEKEREELRQLASGKRRAEQDEDRRINILLEQVIYLLLCLITWKNMVGFKIGLVSSKVMYW
jgi:DNA repair exonuclease SbcCD ATPase subunit